MLSLLFSHMLIYIPNAQSHPHHSLQSYQTQVTSVLTYGGFIYSPSIQVHTTGNGDHARCLNGMQCLLWLIQPKTVPTVSLQVLSKE